MHEEKRGIDLEVCVTLHSVKYQRRFCKPTSWQGFQNTENLCCPSSNMPMCLFQVWAVQGDAVVEAVVWEGSIHCSTALPYTWLLNEAELFVSVISSLVTW